MFEIPAILHGPSNPNTIGNATGSHSTVATRGFFSYLWRTVSWRLSLWPWYFRDGYAIAFKFCDRGGNVRQWHYDGIVFQLICEMGDGC